MGTVWAASTHPSAVGELLMSSVANVRASVAIDVPAKFVSCAAKNHRKFAPS